MPDGLEHQQENQQDKIVLQVHTQHFQCVLDMRSHLADRYAEPVRYFVVCAVLESAGDKYLPSDFRHLADALPEQGLDFGCEQLVRVTSPERIYLVHLHPVSALVHVLAGGCLGGPGLEMVQASVDDRPEGIGFPAAGHDFIPFLPQPYETVVGDVFSGMPVMHIGIGYAYEHRAASGEDFCELFFRKLPGII